MTFGELIGVIVVIGLIALVYFLNALINVLHTGGFKSYPASAAFKKDGNEQKEYTTIDGPFGTKIHIDENGDYAGESIPGAFGNTMIHFDANDEYVGQSMPGMFEGQTYHVDADGNYAGQSNDGLFGNIVHTGKNGETGVTSDGPFGTHVTDIDHFGD